MFKKNTAVTGFGIGHFIGVADGIAVTTGTPTCKRTLDGTGGACANAAAYNTNGAVWTIDLDAGDLNGDVVVLSFTLAGCIPISYTIKTVTKLVSELVDAAAAPSAADNATATAAAILVTPANKLATGATGEASANVTMWKDATAPAMTGDAYARLGAPAGASVSADIAAVKADTAAILVDTGTTLPALVSGLSGAIVSVVSSVDGGTITVYVGDTWRFTLLSEELTLDEYEVLGLVVKRSEKQADDDALLYLRTDDGLVRIGGAAPVDAGNGKLTKTANSFTTLVHLAETQDLVAGSYLWWLKAFDTSVEPSEAKTLATGGFALKRGGLQAVE